MIYDANAFVDDMLLIYSLNKFFCLVSNILYFSLNLLTKYLYAVKRTSLSAAIKAFKSSNNCFHFDSYI